MPPLAPTAVTARDPVRLGRAIIPNSAARPKPARRRKEPARLTPPMIPMSRSIHRETFDLRPPVDAEKLGGDFFEQRQDVQARLGAPRGRARPGTRLGWARHGG